MNRTFHSRVGAGYWLLMVATAFLLFDFFWFHELLLTLLLAIVMIFEIEMLIHTQYVVTAEEICRSKPAVLYGKPRYRWKNYVDSACKKLGNSSRFISGTPEDQLSDGERKSFCTGFPERRR